VVAAAAAAGADAAVRRQEEKGQMAWLEAMGQADLPELGVLAERAEQTLHLQNQKMQEMEAKAGTVKAARRVCLCNFRITRRLPQTSENGRYRVRRLLCRPASLPLVQQPPTSDF
jgi:hypothetical protein